MLGSAQVMFIGHLTIQRGTCKQIIARKFMGAVLCGPEVVNS